MTNSSFSTEFLDPSISITEENSTDAAREASRTLGFE
jgi:hypothetical protein